VHNERPIYKSAYHRGMLTKACWTKRIQWLQVYRLLLWLLVDLLNVAPRDLMSTFQLDCADFPKSTMFE